MASYFSHLKFAIVEPHFANIAAIARRTLARKLCHAVLARGVVLARSRGTLVHVHLTPLAGESFPRETGAD